MLKKFLGYPLFTISALSLVAGIALNFYWSMLFGLLGMAIGSLKVTDYWG